MIEEPNKVVLQSMTDFVASQEEKLIYEDSDGNTYIDYRDSVVLKKIMVFNNFIRQKTELWMFVPCKLVDGKWIPIKFPIYESTHSDNCHCNECEKEAKRYLIEMDEYKEAKERVLFEGWKIEQHNEFTIVLSKDNWHKITIGIKGSAIEKSNLQKIECLIETNTVLTPTAVKQLGLCQS